MPTTESQPNAAYDRVTNALIQIEKIADKSSSAILYMTGIAILIFTYLARFVPIGFRHMEYNEFIFSCVFAALFFIGATGLRLHIDKLKLERATQEVSQLSNILTDAAAPEDQ